MEPIDLSQIGKPSPESDVHLSVGFQKFMIRWGAINDPEHGNLVGVIGEFHLPYLPWMKFRLPMSVGQAEKTANDLLDIIGPWIRAEE